MPLERVGVIFVARNTGAFLKSTGQANDGLMRLRNTLVHTQREFRNTGNAGNNLGNVLTHGLGTALGVTIVFAAEAAIRSLVSLTRYVSSSVQFFERFAVSIETFTALELEMTGAAEDFTSALEMAEKPAKQIMGWMERLAILSPFSIQDIEKGFRTGLAYQFTAVEAARATEAVVDLVSVTNLGADYIQRIILALGQMGAMGRFGGQEIRQLAEAGIPVLDVLAKEFEVTTAAAKKMAELGTVDMDRAMNAVFTFMEERFAGGAERVADTFSGLLTSIKDAVLFASRDLFMPIADSIRPILMGIRDALMDQTIREALIDLGQVLGVYIAGAIERVRASIASLQQWWNGLNEQTREAILSFGMFAAATFAAGVALGGLLIILRLALNPLTTLSLAFAFLATAMTTEMGGAFEFTRDLFRKFGQFFADVAQDAHDWGYAIGEFVARGLIAASELIVKAIEGIAKLFTYWMAPSSPPRYLPQLTQWGRDTADAYLEGWTQADFGILQDMFKTISDLVQTTMKAGGAEDLTINRSLQGILPNLAQAVGDINQFGSISSGTYDELMRSVGGLSNELGTFVNLNLEYLEALKGTEEAQRRLNSVTQRYDDILNPLRRNLQEIANLEDDARDAIRIRELQRIIANAGTTQGQKEAAALEIRRIQSEKLLRDKELERDVAVEQAEGELLAAQEKEDAAKGELDIFSSRLAIQKEAVDLLAKEQSIMAKLASAAEKAAKAAKAAKAGVPEPDLTFDLTGGKTFDEMFGDLDDLGERVGTAFAGLEGAFENFSDVIGTVREAWDGLNQSVGDFLGKWAVIQAAFSISAETMEPVVTSASNMTTPFGQLLITVSELGVKWGEVNEEFLKFRVQYELWEEQQGKIDWEKLLTDVGGLSVKFGDLFVNVVKLFYATGFLIGKIFGLGTASEDTEKKVNPVVSVVDALGQALDWVNGLIETAITGLGNLAAAFDTFWRGPLSRGMGLGSMRDAMPEQGQERPASLVPGQTNVLTRGGTLGPGMQGPLTAAAQDARDATQTIWQGWQDDTGTFIEEQKKWWQSWADWLFNRSLVPDLATNVVDEFRTMGDTIKTNFDTFRTQAQAVWSLIRDTITNLVTETISGEGIGILPQFQGLIDTITDEEYVKVFYNAGFELGKELGRGLEWGAKDAIAGLAAGIIEATKTALQKVRDEFGVESPSKVFASELGEPFGEGVSEGMMDKLYDLSKGISAVVAMQMQRMSAEIERGTVRGLPSNSYMQTVPAPQQTTVVNNYFNLYSPTVAEQAHVLRNFRMMQSMMGTY